MRDYRDAKTMAQTLRDSLTAKAVSISHSESLELVSKMFGVADWNTLAAMLKTDHGGERSLSAKSLNGSVSYPAIPIRDFVPFSGMTFPLFIGREKTIHALEAAFEQQRDIVLAVQKEFGVDEPGSDDVHLVGLLAKPLEVVRLPDTSTRALMRADRRVGIRRFTGASGAFQAEIADLSEEPVPDAHDLIQASVKRFEGYAAKREMRVHPATRPSRRHEYATLEHLLLALADDKDAAAVLQGCGVDLAVLQKNLADYVETAFARVSDGKARPSAAFQRVTQGAAMQAWERNRTTVTGADVLVSLFTEWLSPAMQQLAKQRMTQKDALNFIERGVVKRR